MNSMAYPRDSYGTMASSVDLETLFAHPEGLQKAKDIVVNLLLGSRIYKVSGGSSRTPEYRVSRPMPEMNPEMPVALRDLLMFRDPNAQFQRTRPFGYNPAMEMYPKDREISDTSHIQLSPCFPPPFHQPQTGDNSRASYHIERPNRPINLGHSSMKLLSHTNSLQQNSSLNPEIASPYTNNTHSQQLPPISELEKPTSTSNSLPPISSDTTTNYSNITRPSVQVATSKGPTAYPPHLRNPGQSSNSSQATNSARSVNSNLTHRMPYREISARPGQPQSGLSVTYSPIEFNRQSNNSSGAFTGPTLCPAPSKERTWTPIQSRAPYSSQTTNTLNSSMAQFGKLIVPKRKTEALEKSAIKKQKRDKTPKPKRIPKPKVTKDEPARFQIPDAIWMRIFELSPPAFLIKVRTVSKRFKGMVDGFDSIYDYCRKENFGYDMPDAPLGINTRKYNNLLRGGKGCLNPGCDDKNATRAHWSWATRWCIPCWKSKIEREDRVVKSRSSDLSRPVLERLLQCVAYGMHDSFMKPHDISEPGEERGRTAPRLYKYYLVEDVTAIIAEYKTLTPPPHVEDPTHSPEQKAAAVAAHRKLVDGAEAAKTTFIAERKAKNDEHMDQVKRIEAGMRMRRETNAVPYKENRESRKNLFTKRAQEEIGYVPTEFVQNTKAFKAATRIFRDGGTERGWQTLKPKIVKEWEDSKTEGGDVGAGEPSPDADDGDDLSEEEIEDNIAPRMNMGTNQIPVVQNFLSQAPQQTSFTQEHHMRQHINSIHQQHAQRTMVQNGFPPMQTSNQGHFHGMIRPDPRLTLQMSFNPHSSASNNMVNSSFNQGRSNMHLGIDMFSNGPTFGNMRTFPPSYQQQHESMGANHAMSSAQNTPSTIMAISSIIQQPFGFNPSD